MREREIPTATALRIFVLFAAIYCITMSGWIDSADGQNMYQVTRSIVEQGDFSVPANLMGVVGRGNKKYSPYGLGLSLAATPLYLLGTLVSRAFPNSDLVRSHFTSDNYLIEFTVQLLTPLTMAAVVSALFCTLVSLNFTQRISILTSLVFGVATPAWPYSKSFFANQLATLFLILAALFVVRYRIEKRRPWLALCGVAIGLAALTYLASLLTAGAILLYFGLSSVNRRESARSILVSLLHIGIPLGAILLVIGAYNWWRFANPLETGYAANGDTVQLIAPLLFGLYGQLFSSGKSIFLYAPTLIISGVGMSSLLRKAREEGVLVALVTCSNVLFYSKVNVWYAGWGWGLRYLFVVIPFSMIPLAQFLEDTHPTPSFRMIFALFMMVIGFFVQVLGVTVPYEAYLSRVPNSHKQYDYMYMPEANFVPSYSPLVGHWGILRTDLSHLKSEIVALRSGAPRVEFGRGWYTLDSSGGVGVRRSAANSTLTVMPAHWPVRTVDLTVDDNMRDDGKPTALSIAVGDSPVPQQTVTLSAGRWQTVSIDLSAASEEKPYPLLVRLTVQDPWVSPKTGGRPFGVAVETVSIDGEPVASLREISWAQTDFADKIELIHQSVDFWWVKVFYTELPMWLLLAPSALGMVACVMFKLLCDDFKEASVAARRALVAGLERLPSS